MNFNQLFKAPQLSQAFIEKMVYDIENQDSLQTLKLQDIYSKQLILPTSEFLTKKENETTTKNTLYNKIFFNYLINLPILSGDDLISANFKDGTNIIINSNNYQEKIFEKKVEQLFKDVSYKNSFVELKIEKKPIDKSIFLLTTGDILESLIFISIFSNAILRKTHDIKLLSMGFNYRGSVARISNNTELRSLAFNLSKDTNNHNLTKYLETLTLDYLVKFYNEVHHDSKDFTYGKWIK